MSKEYHSVISHPIKRKKLSDFVEDELELLIRSGQYQEGQPLPSERELMTMFDVGRSSIREALFALKRKGLLQINNGERAKVCRPNPETIMNDMYGIVKDYLMQPNGIEHFEQLRLLFEISLVRYAAKHATEQQLGKLGNILHISHESSTNNELFHRTDVEFHRMLASIPGNPLFITIHTALIDWLISSRTDPINSHKSEQFNHLVCDEHEKIYNAILNRDPDLAEKTLTDHLKRVFSIHYALNEE